MGIFDDSGIGKVYAERLSKKGYDLLVWLGGATVSECLPGKFSQQHRVQVKTCAAEVGDQPQLEGVAKAVSENEQIALLVNNAGTFFVGPLDVATVEQLTGPAHIKIVALTRLAMAVLPGFKSGNQGTVVNIGCKL